MFGDDNRMKNKEELTHIHHILTFINLSSADEKYTNVPDSVANESAGRKGKQFLEADFHLLRAQFSFHGLGKSKFNDSFYVR